VLPNFVKPGNFSLFLKKKLHNAKEIRAVKTDFAVKL